MGISDAAADADAAGGVGVTIELNETMPLSVGVDDVEASIVDDSADDNDADTVNMSVIDIELDSVTAEVGLTSAVRVPSAAEADANLGELEPLPVSSPVDEIDCVLMIDEDANSVAEIVGEGAREALGDADKLADSDCAAEAVLEKLRAALMVGGVSDSDTHAEALTRDGDTLVDAVTPLPVGSELCECNIEWLVRIVAEGQWVDDDESKNESEGSEERDAVGVEESAIVLVIVIVTKLDAERDGARENENAVDCDIVKEATSDTEARAVPLEVAQIEDDIV